jgi:hypothetical protein
MRERDGERWRKMGEMERKKEREREKAKGEYPRFKISVLKAREISEAIDLYNDIVDRERSEYTERVIAIE